MIIHISNLPLGLIETDLRRLFLKYGEVVSVTLVRDTLTNRSRGRAFLQMQDPKEAKNAIATLNGYMLNGKTIRVDELAYDPSSSTHNFFTEEN